MSGGSPKVTILSVTMLSPEIFEAVGAALRWAANSPDHTKTTMTPTEFDTQFVEQVKVHLGPTSSKLAEVDEIFSKLKLKPYFQQRLPNKFKPDDTPIEFEIVVPDGVQDATHFVPHSVLNATNVPSGGATVGSDADYLMLLGCRILGGCIH